MKPNFADSYKITALTIILSTLAAAPAKSQPITPANDGTGTSINQNGNQFNIQGGTRSGANLFHSFDKFNVNSGQTANFMTTPDTRNILGRVTGGNASYVNGLIQVIGGNSNLFLMNPAGLMFGSNASLNIPASFSVTTATGIGFDSNNFWFQAMGTNDYGNLVGDPSGYRFNVSNPGAIVNEGNLSLNPGENLTLLGGTVINTGELSTAGGNITIAAVEGGSVLRISQPGHLLSLDVDSSVASSRDMSEFSPLSLPELLTGGEETHASSVIVNANGEIVLSDSNTLVADVPGSAITSGSINVSLPPNPPYEGGDNSLPLSKGDGRGIGGQVNVLGDRVALINGNINANGINGGGTVLIGGDFQGNGIVPNSQHTSVNNNSFISADAINNGDGGRVIIWSDGITDFGGNISAKGGEFSGNGGFVEVSGKQQLIFDGNVNVSAALGNTGTILLDPENIILGGSESNTSLENTEGNIILLADNDITINENIETDSSVELKAGRSININADIDTSVGNGNIDLFGNNDEMNFANRSNGKASINQLDGTTLNAGSGTINIQLGNLGEVGDINLASLTTTGQVLVNANGGNIARVSENSIINAGSVLFQTSGNGGIGLTDAPLQLNVENLEAVSGSGGVFFDVFRDVNIGGVSEEVVGISSNDGGDITLESQGDVTVTEDIKADVVTDGETGGDININAKNLSAIDGARISASTFAKGNAGNINITAEDTVIFDGVFNDSPSGVFSAVRPEVLGDAGDITIKTGSLTVKNGAQIASSTFGKGNPGNVEINATETILFDAGGSDFTGAFSFVEEGAEANANDSRITITTRSLEVKNGAKISAGTNGNGDAGDVIITATDTVFLDQAFPSIRSGVLSAAGPQARGNAGDITITTRFLEVKNAASISADTRGTGNGGNVEITATDTILFDGALPNSRRRSGVDSTVRTGGVGDAGNITIKTGSLEVKNGARIGSQTEGTGNGGNVTITADTILFNGTPSNGRSSSALTTVRPGAVGNAGNVIITTGSLELTNGAAIDSRTDGKGNAGNVEITATDTVLFDGGGSGTRISRASSSVRPRAEGNGGNVSITTGSLELTNGALISSSTEGKGDAGNIFIRTHSLLKINENASISAFTETKGKGGNVIITAPENLNITGNGEITVSSRGAGNASQIDILSPNITLSDGIDITAFTESTGNAGIINLEGDNINIQPNTRILAFTENEGDGGNITVRATETLNLDADSQLSVETNRGGKAGNIEINTPQLTIGQNAQISATVNIGATSTEPGGNITINTNELNIAGELGIFAETEATADAGSLTLSPYKTNPNLDITFTNDGFISASTSSTGNGGNINISAPETINIQGNGFIAVETTDIGNAGTINIDTKNLTLSDQVAISASTEDKGNAGVININTNNLTLETGTSLTTETNDAGKAGEIEINTRQLTIGEDAQISATAREGATNTEAGGNITINATDLFISGRLGIFAETAGESPAGTLTLNPYRRDGGMGRGGDGESRRQLGTFDSDLNITFTEQGFISARTTSIGDGGNINIFAPENINISGDGFISVETTGAGNAGTINIETENLTIAENTTISASTSDSGDGGSININSTETFQLEGQILTETTGTGNGGAIAINTGELTAPNSTISAKSTDAGNAGTIDITAQENITTGMISSQANNQNETADGGNITITSERGEINATQPIQSFSETANAGDVTLNAQNNITTDTISSHGQKQGGEITMTSETGNIDTSNGNFLANYSGGGDAGNVSLSAPKGDITTTDIFSFADGDGGEISLKAGGDINIIEGSNIISASEPPGEQGSAGVGRGGVGSGGVGRGGVGSGGVGRAGDIILEAGNNINTTTAQIYSGADVGDTGKIDIIAEGGIETGEINLASGFVRNRVTVNENFTLIPIPGEEATQGVAGNITLRSNNSTIDTTAGTINSRSPDGTGNITLNARENITTGKLEASALNPNQPTTGGDVSITSIQGQINATEAIETFSERGTAGNVNLKAEGSVNIENILSQGRQRGGDITIDSRSENSINAQGELNTFSTEGIAGDVNLTSPGNITINGIRSEGMQQGGTITVESEIGEITSTENIDSFSEQGIGGNVLLNASESINLANVSSFGATESGDLIIQSRTAQVNTGNVTTEAPAGSSGSIIINGEEVGTGDLSSIGTTSAGEINVEATDGSITTYDIEISSDGTIGNLALRATEDVTTGDINQNAGEGDANINIESGEDQTTGDINQTAENDTNNIQTAEGDLTTGDITQTAGNDTNNIQIAEGDLTTGDITQTAGNNTNNIQIAEGNQNIGNVTQTAGNNTNNIQIAEGNQNIGNVTQNAGNDANNIQIAEGNQNIGNVTQNVGNDATNIQTAQGNQNIGNVTQNASNNTINIQTAGSQQNLGQINQTFGNESINIQLPEINQNPDNTSLIPNNNTPIINQILNQENPGNNNINIPSNLTNNTNLLNQIANNNNPSINPSTTNNLLNSTTSNLISTITPSNNNQITNTPIAQHQKQESINHTTHTHKISKRIDSVHSNSLTVATGSNQVITMLEQNRTNEYSNYLGTDLKEQSLSTKNVREILKDMAAKTGKESAIVYINAYPEQLQIILYTKDGQPIIKTIPEANRKKLMKSVLKLRAQITNPVRRYTDSYLPPAQQLYDWLIAPISAELEVANIDTLLFSMDEGLRTLPVAVLHDGQEFLIEKYSISLIPSVSLMDSNYRPLQDTQVLAMGASEFLEQQPLPAVPVELKTISQKLWQGSKFINENFTRNNLLNERKNYPYPIIHLATHAEFLPGQASNSYIQLWGSEQIKLDQVRELGWSQPAVELLVLSACRTAIGDRNAELGFAGLAVAAGVKSALASVWYVSDEGTLGLMTEFYTHLNNAKIKAEALRQAQLAMLRGEVVIVDGELRGSGARGAVVLPSTLGKFGSQDFSHPYYWAGFTMVGSPW
ncbi:CHAT domain-containing protein [Dapis sp. BLCC M229]|uniref:CHAT domain-containing protein n=1 Tax=Dapis sp. BLCC M229 TaxID=3400188 RepID=UPI003CF6961A